MIVSEVGRPMYGWNFLEPEQVKPRNELRRCSQEEEEKESIDQKISRFRTIIVETLRDFPDAYRAVLERLRQIPLPGGT